MRTNGKFEAIRSVQEGFRIAGLNWGLMIGFVIVSTIISAVLGNIPFIGNIYTYLVAPVIGFGFVIGARKLDNNERLDFGNFFDGFKKFVPLAITNLISVLVTLLFAIPLIYQFINAFGGFEECVKLFSGLKNSFDPEAQQDAVRQMKEGILELNIPMVLLSAFFILIPSFFLTFPMYYVWFKDQSPIDAISSSVKLFQNNIGSSIGLVLLNSLLILIGVLTCCIGFLFFMPTTMAATYSAFRDAEGVGEEFKTVSDHLVDGIA